MHTEYPAVLCSHNWFARTSSVVTLLRLHPDNHGHDCKSPKAWTCSSHMLCRTESVRSLQSPHQCTLRHGFAALGTDHFRQCAAARKAALSFLHSSQASVHQSTTQETAQPRACTRVGQHLGNQGSCSNRPPTHATTCNV